uniref:phage terminase large subunit n=1 Tax=Altererythrobacter segetis TaxID=1104773 RepID=UPI00140CB2F8|nr:phage terminase large subunit [Altererythrobacter segetis]
MNLERDLLRAVLQNDLASFAQRAIAEVLPALTLEWNWHLDLIADRLTQLADGKIQRLLICVPPRSLKSLLCSVVYPAWLLARNDAERILCISYSQPLAEDFARLCRQLMDSGFYQASFKTRLSADRRAVEQFETTGGGGRIASSVHGTVTGRGGDFIILDDPMKAEDALSEVTRKGVVEWMRSTLSSRPNSKRDARLLVVMQRLHEEDVAGYLIAQGGWDALSLPAIAVEAEEHQYSVAGRATTFRRAPGEALHRDREPVEILEQLRLDMGNLVFAAQYQQNPLPTEGNLVKRSWFGQYGAVDLVGLERVIQSWDTGSKTAMSHDYSVCTTWGLKAGMVYLIDVWRGRLEMPELCRKVIELSDRFSPERVLVEDKGSGTALMQALRAQCFYKAVPVLPKGEKVVRLSGVSPMMEAGHVRLPASAPWLDGYLYELCGFPGTKHDDQVDSTSQALHWVQDEGSAGGLFEYYRREHEALVARQTHRTVRLRAPDGVSHVTTIDGTKLTVGPDRSLYATEAEAGPFMAAGFRRIP